MNEVLVQPKAGLLVPFAPESRPHGRRHLRPEGELVTDSTWWRRREREGDVTISLPEPPEQKPTPTQVAPKGKQ